MSDLGFPTRDVKVEMRSIETSRTVAKGGTLDTFSATGSCDMLLLFLFSASFQLLSL